MKTSDQYHKWVEWSEEDQTYLGKCPDLITGIHGDDPVQLYIELCQVVEDVIQQLDSSGQPLPKSRIHPMLFGVGQKRFLAPCFIRDTFLPCPKPQ